MLSIILSVCISFAGYETCEGKLISQHETMQECLEAMASLEAEVSKTHIAKFDYQIACTAEE